MARFFTLAILLLSFAVAFADELGVSLNYFRAGFEGTDVKVEWEVASENTVTGFDVYRKLNSETSFRRINEVQTSGARRYADGDAARDDIARARNDALEQRQRQRPGKAGRRRVPARPGSFAQRGLRDVRAGDCHGAVADPADRAEERAVDLNPTPPSRASGQVSMAMERGPQPLVCCPLDGSAV